MSQSIAPIVERLERRTLFVATVFSIDPAQSSLVLEAEVGGFTLVQPETDTVWERYDDGSLTARYGGTIVADYVRDNFVRFLGGSEIVAETVGPFNPGDAPGNYGEEVRQAGAVALEALVRDLRLDVLSGPIFFLGYPSERRFPSGPQTFRVTSGDLSWHATPGPGGAADLRGAESANAAAEASLASSDGRGEVRLEIPVDVTFAHPSAGVRLRLRGKLAGSGQAGKVLRPRVDANGAGFGATSTVVFDAASGPGSVAAVATGEAGLTVFDPDSTALIGATVALLNTRNGAAETLALSTAGTPLTVTASADGSVLTLAGAGTAADYQAAFRTLSYRNSAPLPTVGSRTVSIVVSDAEGPGTAGVGVISVAEPLRQHTVQIGSGATRSVTFTDPDGTVTTLSLTGGGTAAVTLEGSATQTTRGGRTVFTGRSLELVRVEATGTTPATNLAFKTAGGDDDAADLPDAAVLGPLRAFGGKGLNVVGRLDFDGRVNSVVVRGLNGAKVTAPGVGKFTVARSFADSLLALEDPFDPVRPALGALAVRYDVGGSRIESGGTIGSIKAMTLWNSEVYAGVAGQERLPSAPSAFVNQASVGRVTLNAPPGTREFRDSVIAASHLGRLNLGDAAIYNSLSPFGVAADRIDRLTVANTNSRPLRLSNLEAPGDPAAQAERLGLGSFQYLDLRIRVV